MSSDEYGSRIFSLEEEADFSGPYTEISIRALPTELFQRKKLISLVCQENSLEAIPAEISQLEWLENLDLQDNYISEVDPAINQLKYLQRVVLSRNKLQTLEMSGPIKLKFLYLTSNQLKVLHPSLFQLPELKILDLSFNQLQCLPTISAPLEELWVSSNQLVHIEMIDSESLILLHLSDNRLKTLPQINAPQLKYLTINSNAFTELPPAVKDLNQLESLDLDFELFELPQLQLWPHLKCLTLYKALHEQIDTEAILLEKKQVTAYTTQLETALQFTHPELKLRIHSYLLPRRMTD